METRCLSASSFLSRLHQAVKEFIETDGELSKSIEWIANKDLPPNTFPEPWNLPPDAERSYPDVT
jgi:hypothetical protein